MFKAVESTVAGPLVRIWILGLSLWMAPASPHAAELSGIQSLRTKNFHTCAVLTGGGVQCWGNNGNGQLGDATNHFKPYPTPVSTLSSGAVDVATGHFHSCARTTTGGVKCWGTNLSGQLGDGTFTERNVPGDVSGLSGVSALAVGGDHSCVIVTGGAVKCWGSNIDGQLGNNQTANSAQSVAVTGLASGVVAITAGGSHSCALTAAGAAMCWGDNSSGQVGNNATTDQLTPVTVQGLATGVVAIEAGGSHTCAIKSSGGVVCWGDNSNGQLGDGTTTLRSAPVDATGLASGTAEISLGSQHSCARSTAGLLKCWGANAAGQIGDGSITPRWAPVDVLGLGAVSSVSAGGNQTCAIAPTGTGRCWGQNRLGQLGDGNDGVKPAPQLATLVPQGTAIVGVGNGFSCILTGAGAVQCAGVNTIGQLGDGSAASSRPTFASVNGLEAGARGLAVGSDHACAITSGEGLKCWGNNAYGQLGDNSFISRATPVDVSSLSSGVRSVSTSRDSTCVVTTAGAVKCWGRNQRGQLGDGTTTHRSAPVAVSGLGSGVVAVAAGDLHTCAITSQGSLKCWGSNSQGALGNGSNTSSSVPVDVSGMSSGVVAVGAGNSHVCALTDVGTVKCWGWNFYGQLGDGTNSSRSVPAQVPGVSGANALFVGSLNSCAVSLRGEVWCWGVNNGGPLGDGTTVNRWSATLTQPLGSRPLSLAIRSHACAALAHGPTKCWGGNGYGELGTGAVAYRGTPAPVLVGTPGALFMNPTSVAFGGQSLETRSYPAVITLVNPTATSATVSSVTVPQHFVASHDCASLAPAASCRVTVNFAPEAEGSLAGTLAVGHSAGTQQVALSGTGERSLVTHYYNAILGRVSDEGGKQFWTGEAERMKTLGVNVNETWYAMAGTFYNSGEYAQQARDGSGYVQDLYTTFYDRSADAGGLQYWIGQMDGGMPREVVLVSFMFSQEFTQFAEAIFGNTAARKEVDTVVDFYRGLLARLPDSGGFTHWVQQFRAAQCQGAEAVYAKVEEISSAYTASSEYGARARSNAQFVGDLYNAFLRRGADLEGVKHWIAQLDSGALSREDLRRTFIASPEFSARVNAIVTQGCMQ